jgi:hypothetical protein
MNRNALLEVLGAPRALLFFPSPRPRSRRRMVIDCGGALGTAPAVLDRSLEETAMPTKFSDTPGAAERALQV